MQGLKLKAGALQLTLCIVIVIALLLMTFILFIHTHNRFNTQNNFVIETIKNSNKGIDFTILNDLKLHDTITIEGDKNEHKTLKVHSDFWGVYEKVTSVSKIKKNSIKKMALVGGIQKNKDRTTLYLQDNNKPLVVVGNTKINGLSYVPKKGVKSGSISGHNYYGSQLIYGNTKTSNKLPKLHTKITNQINNLNHQYLNAKPEQFINIINGNTYQNSFYKPVQFIFSSEVINLNSIKLIGHIIIQSKTRIIIESSTILKDVILIAPEIEVQNDTKGNFQAFVNKSIVIGSNVKLDYPSALVLSENKTQSSEINIKKAKVLLKSGSKIKGSIIYLGQPNPNNYEPQIELELNTTVFGDVYCNQNIELKGSVFGSIHTNNFIAKQSGSVFQNHIYNGTIIIDNLPQQYAGIRLSNYDKGIAKWLY